MSAFNFSLQRVLELRERREQQSAQELAEARGEADKARQVHADLEATRDAGRARMALANWVGGAVGHVRNLIEVVGRVDAQIVASETECGEAEKQVAESLKVMEESARERKVIDRLRERHWDQWQIEQAGNERKTMDELASIRHHRADPHTSRSGD